MYNPDNEEALGELIEWVSDRIDSELQKCNGTPKVYIDSEFDSRQSEYERLSNMREIGVVASSDELGYCMCRLLRAVIDGNSLVIEPDEGTSYEDFFKELCEDAGTVTAYNLEGPFTGEIWHYGEDRSKEPEKRQIATDWTTCDVWCWQRLKATLEELL